MFSSLQQFPVQRCHVEKKRRDELENNTQQSNKGVGEEKQKLAEYGNSQVLGGSQDLHTSGMMIVIYKHIWVFVDGIYIILYSFESNVLVYATVFNRLGLTDAKAPLTCCTYFFNVLL